MLRWLISAAARCLSLFFHADAVCRLPRTIIDFDFIDMLRYVAADMRCVYASAV